MKQPPLILLLCLGLILVGQTAESKDPADAYFNAGQESVWRGDDEAAERLFSQVIVECPTQLGAYLNRALCRRRLGKYNLALEDYATCLERSPECPTARLGIARVLIDMNRLEQAVDSLTPLTTTGDSSIDAIALQFRGMARHRLKMFDLAVADFDRALEIDSRCITVYRARGDSLVASASGMSGVTRSMQLEWAITDYDSVIKLLPEDKLTLLRRSEALRLAAMAFNGPNRDALLQRAVADCERVLTSQPQDCQALLQRANCTQWNGEVGVLRAIDDCSQVVDTCRDRDERLRAINMRLQLREQLDLVQSLDDYALLLGVSPADTDLRRRYVQKLMRHHLYETASVQLTKSLDGGSNQEDLRNRKCRAICEIALGHLEAATLDVQHILVRHLESRWAHFYLGLIQTLSGDFASAETEFATVLATSEIDDDDGLDGDDISIGMALLVVASRSHSASLESVVAEFEMQKADSSIPDRRWLELLTNVAREFVVDEATDNLAGTKWDGAARVLRGAAAESEGRAGDALREFAAAAKISNSTSFCEMLAFARANLTSMVGAVRQNFGCRLGDTRPREEILAKPSWALTNVTIESIVPDSQAARMGLRPGEQLLTLNGNPVQHSRFWIELCIATLRPGLEIDVLREGTVTTLQSVD